MFHFLPDSVFHFPDSLFSTSGARRSSTSSGNRCSTSSGFRVPLVLGVLKQGLGCDFDRLHDLTNHHQTIRAFLGHGDFDDKTRYEYQTVVDNVSLLTPELLSRSGAWWWRADTR